MRDRWATTCEFVLEIVRCIMQRVYASGDHSIFYASIGMQELS